MKKLVGVFLLSLPMLAVASNCEEISAKIADKIKNNGVDAAHFQLKLEPIDKSEQQVEGKIVGYCDHGQQHIVYVRLDDVATQQSQPQSKPTTPVQSDQPATN